MDMAKRLTTAAKRENLFGFSEPIIFLRAMTATICSYPSGPSCIIMRSMVINAILKWVKSGQFGYSKEMTSSLVSSGQSSEFSSFALTRVCVA